MATLWNGIIIEKDELEERKGTIIFRDIDLVELIKDMEIYAKNRSAIGQWIYPKRYRSILFDMIILGVTLKVSS